MSTIKTPEGGQRGPSSHEGGEQTPPKGFSIRVESPDLIFKAAKGNVSGELGILLLKYPLESISVRLESDQGKFNLFGEVKLNSKSMDTIMKTHADIRADVCRRVLERYKERFPDGSVSEQGGQYVITTPKGRKLILTRSPYESLDANEFYVTTGSIKMMGSEEFNQIYPSPSSNSRESFDGVLADFIDVIKITMEEVHGATNSKLPKEELVLRPPKIGANGKNRNRGLGGLFGEIETPADLLGKIEIEKPGVKFADVGGQTEAKREIQGLAFALKNPELYKKWGTRPPKGVILYGPPGTGKTLMAKALASQADARFFHVQASDIASKWYGESEKIVKSIFDLAAKTEEKTIIFFDEIDTIAPQREVSHEATQKTVSTLLENMDGIASNGNIMIVASTNRLKAVDSALLRAGRFDRWIEVSLPDGEGRKQIFNIHMRNAEKIADRKLFLEINIDQLVEKTDGYSGADVAEIIRRTLEEKVRKEGTMDFEPNLVDTENIIFELEYYEKIKNKENKR